MEPIRLFIKRLEERPYTGDDQHLVMRYLQGALAQGSLRKRHQSRQLANLIREYGLGSNALQRFGEDELGDFDRVKLILLELARHFESDDEKDREWHDTALSLYDEADAFGRKPTVSIDSQKMAIYPASTCDEDPEEQDDSEKPATPSGRWTVEQVVDACQNQAAGETPEGQRVIGSLITLLQGSARTAPKLFKKNEKLNVSGIHAFMGPGAPAHRTIKRVLTALNIAVQNSMRGPRATEPRYQVKPDNIVGAIMTTTPPPVPGVTPIPDALLDRLRELREVYHERLRYPHDNTLQNKLGYLCTREGRLAATEVYRNTNRVDSITPGLPRSDLGAVGRSLREFLRQVMSGEILRDPDDPLMRLMTTLRTDGNVFSVGESAIRAAVALLGLNEYGGVFAAWQLQALAFTLMSWDDHVAFNSRILVYARGLCPGSARDAAEKYDLPDPQYLEAGSLGNIVNANYRIALGDGEDVRRHEARRAGDRVVEELEEFCGGDLRTTMKLDCLQVARAACAQIHGDRAAAERYWAVVPPADLPRILDDIRRIEPCVPVREQVIAAARVAVRF